ncbi:EF-hand domain-containing protein [Acuticoccus mangrovi]|uniref:EF-hand domain-containing protein n=1 Tax=Acuticoccus mangrovi TaxID=2796142 RepID=A0A934ML62_9HYPH|nr:hypothetical protein [Acuticoccus mangrovi]MBJ3776069.1 hypothetical protein [Acuticoccus mangrovi]
MTKPITMTALVAGTILAGAMGAHALTVGPAAAPATNSDVQSVQFDGPPRGPGGPRGMGPGGMGPMGPGGPLMMMMRDADTNEDGALTQDEVDAFLAEKFAIGDTDGDGEVTLKDFEAIWLDLTRPMMVRTFQMLDEDGSAVITTEELDKRFGNVVQHLDRNDDGKLDRADRRHARGERGGRHGFRKHDRGGCERPDGPRGPGGPRGPRPEQAE